MSNLCTSHGRDQFGAVFGDASSLGVLANHESGDVLEQGDQMRV
jgi:hypothetical protein